MKQAPLIRFRIDFAENSNLGPGKIALLEGIRTYGSMSEAARRMGISYRRAWLLLDSLNKSFNLPATVNSAAAESNWRRVNNKCGSQCDGGIRAATMWH